MKGETIGSVQIFTTTTFKELYDMVEKQCPYLNDSDDEISILQNKNNSGLIYSGKPDDIVIQKIDKFDSLIVGTTETIKNENHKIANSRYVLMISDDIPFKYNSIYISRNISRVIFLNQRDYKEYYPIFVLQQLL